MLSALCAVALVAAATPDSDAPTPEVLAPSLPVAADTVPESVPRMAGSAEGPTRPSGAGAKTTDWPWRDTRFHLRLLGGASRWRWNEVVDGQADLEENGWEPDLVVQSEISNGPVVLGAGFEGLRGAIDYDGYLQSPGGVLTKHASSTYYLFMESSTWLHLRFPLRHANPHLGVRLSAPWWRRTIGARHDGAYDRYGYIETWSGLHLSPEFGIDFASSPRTVLRLDVALVVPQWTRERIEGSLPGTLEPKATTGKRLTATLLVQPSLLFQIEWFAMDFRESDPIQVRTTKALYTVYQPESSLDRIAVRMGYEM